MSMKMNSAYKRLQVEYRRLMKDPIPYLTAQPLPSNFLEWRYVIRGPNKTPYDGGIYYGKIVFPHEYPFKPPSIYMFTPNGRFQTNTSLCLTITSYHPDSWNPSWSISSILNGFLSFMCDTTATHGSIETSEAEKRRLAYDSLSFNVKDSLFCQLFPEISEEIRRTLSERKENSSSSTIDATEQTNLCRNVVSNVSSDGSWLNNIFSNILVILVFLGFALLVHFILDATG